MAERDVCSVTRVELVWPGKYHEDGTVRSTPVPRLPLVRAMVCGGRQEQSSVAGCPSAADDRRPTTDDRGPREGGRGVTKHERVAHERLQRELRGLREDKARVAQVLGALLGGVDEIAWCLERGEPVGTEVLREMTGAAERYREALAAAARGRL